ncbi:MAG: hypothetical protein LBL94_03935 [Prevotellaceae bacterium]|jgi:hypothetical protein|nr:hypothetical protein [Prevotellaceae bacterium]
MYFIRLNVCAALLCCIFAACSNNDEKKWEPEMALSLALFDVDISQYLGIDTLTKNLFERIPSALQKNSLARAIIVLQDSMDRSVEESLSAEIRSQIGNFMILIDRWDSGHTDPLSLLNALMDSFRSNGQFFAINRFAYEIMDEVKGRDTSFRAEIDSLLAGRYIDFKGSMSIDIKQAANFDEINQIQWIKIQVLASSKLQVNAKLQADMYNVDSAVIDSMLYADGKNGIEMPFPQKAENKVRIVHDYGGQEAKLLISSIGGFTTRIFSPALGLTLNQVKDLHNLKVNVSIGLMLKATFGDAVE